MNLSEAKNNLVLLNNNPRTAFLRNLESFLGRSGYLEKNDLKSFRKNVAPAIIHALSKYDEMNSKCEDREYEIRVMENFLFNILADRKNK